MPSARLTVDLLRWLGFGGGGASDDASFLHVGCGNGYVNAVIAVVQQWKRVNIAAALGDDAALAGAVGRVAAFARAAGVFASTVKPLPTLATSDTFDRVLVSYMCLTPTYARDRFGSLLAQHGCLVAPVLFSGKVIFIRYGRTGDPKELHTVADREQVALLKQLFPVPPPLETKYSNQPANVN